MLGVVINLVSFAVLICASNDGLNVQNSSEVDGKIPNRLNEDSKVMFCCFESNRYCKDENHFNLSTLHSNVTVNLPPNFEPSKTEALSCVNHSTFNDDWMFHQVF
jgi:hypothetical protein